jgi:hypothetical protein
VSEENVEIVRRATFGGRRISHMEAFLDADHAVKDAGVEG